MAGRLLALEWNDRSATAIEAQIDQKQVCVRRCVRFHWPPDLDIQDDPERAGVWLRAKLDAEDFHATQTVVTLPRDAVVIKHVRLPDALPRDLAQLVQLQAEGRALIPSNELCLDFVPLPSLDDDTFTNVLLAMVRKRLVDTYRKVLHAAQLDFEALGLSPLAAHELLLQQIGGEKERAFLMICRTERGFEISLVYQGCVTASHTHTTETLDDDAEGLAVGVVAAVRRFLAAVREPIAAEKADQIWLLDDAEHSGLLKSALEMQLELPVQVVDPMNCVRCERSVDVGEFRHRVAGPLGMLVSRVAGQAATINFLAPRRPPVHRHRHVFVTAACAILAIVVAFAFWLQVKDRQRALDRQIDFLTNSEQILELRNRNGQDLLDEAAVVGSWAEDSVPWLDQMLQLSRHLPPSDRTYMSSLRLQERVGNKPSSIKASGYAREQNDVMTLNERLLKARDIYEIQPHGFQPSKKDAFYQTRFELEVHLVAPTQRLDDAVGDQTKRGSSSLVVPEQLQPNLPISEYR